VSSMRGTVFVVGPTARRPRRRQLRSNATERRDRRREGRPLDTLLVRALVAHATYQRAQSQAVRGSAVDRRRSRVSRAQLSQRQTLFRSDHV